MLCCVIAMMIVAHLTAMVRRWLVFFGLVRPRPDEDADTIYRRIAAYLRRPRVRRFVTAAVAVELLVGGAWIGVGHAEHLYRIGDQAVGRLRGEHVSYVATCDPDRAGRVLRFAVSADGRVTTREI